MTILPGLPLVNTTGDDGREVRVCRSGNATNAVTRSRRTARPKSARCVKRNANFSMFHAISPSAGKQGWTRGFAKRLPFGFLKNILSIKHGDLSYRRCHGQGKLVRAFPIHGQTSLSVPPILFPAVALTRGSLEREPHAQRRNPGVSKSQSVANFLIDNLSDLESKNLMSTKNKGKVEESDE